MASHDSYHRKDGRKYDRVTDILRAIHNESWWQMMQSMGRDRFWRIMHEAANRGTALHGYIERLLKGTMTDSIRLGIKASPHGLGSTFEAVEKWLADNVEAPMHIEEVIYDEENGIAGCPDLVARLKSGQVALIDYKSGTVIPDTTRLQLAAYVDIMKQGPMQRIVLHAREGRVKRIDYDGTTLDEDIVKFKYATILYREFVKPHVKK